MIQISREEAKYLKSIDPSIYITVTGRGKKARNKRRYVEEDMRAMRLLPNNPAAVRLVEAWERAEELRRRWRAAHGEL